MADMEMIKIATGERTRFMIDGSVVKDQVDPPKIEWCDRCEAFKRFAGGRYDTVMGSPELWYCESKYQAIEIAEDLYVEGEVWG